LITLLKREKLDIDPGHGRGRRGKYLPSGPTERAVQRSSNTTAMPGKWYFYHIHS